MRQLNLISIIITILGVVIVVAAETLGLSPAWTLAGLLLAIAGAVKIVVVHLWRTSGVGIAGRTGVDEG